jgi:signal transduction histidine kinase/ActR/RegA family two-component response regulator
VHLDSQRIRSEPHEAIGTLLQENVDVLVDLWAERAIQEQPHAKRVHHAVLHNHLHEFLRTLGRSLAESEDGSTCQHCLPASIHGEQRWDTGWSLPEVVRDFQILRLVVVDFLEKRLDRRLAHREILAIGLALDEAISASVVTYTQDRDQYLKQVEAERIEEVKQAQQRLQQHADDLLAADRRKNEFLAMLAHELRNPLAPLRNAIDFLRLKGPVDPELQWTRDLIDRQVEQMTRMVDDLLDISRITLGKINLQKEPVDVATLVARAVEEVRPLIDKRKHQLTVQLPPESLWLTGDPTRLTQILANLLQNAAKYTEAGGEIWISAERAAEEALIRVRDNGMGIPEDLLQRVFEPFMQEDRLQIREKRGLGIGLALVKSLLDLHGGRIEALSAGRGRGSEFVVRLPLLKETRAAPRAATKSPPPKAPARRILVVDDNEDAAQSLKILLELYGHKVQIALSGAAALETVQAGAPDVVLLDIGLPKMDGLEVARRFRADPKLKATLLVAVTGYGQDEDRRRSQEAGIDARLVKPLGLDALHEILAGFVQQVAPPKSASEPKQTSD